MKNNGQIISRLFRNSVISIIAAAIATMIGVVVDGIIIGRFLGEDCMAAYGLITPVINLATAFSGILATGSQVVCAQRLGAGNAEKARRAFSMCIVVTVIVSILMMLIFGVFRNNVCVLLGARGKSAHLLPLVSDYLLGMIFAFPSLLLLFEFNSLMRLDGDPNRVIVAVVVMTALDIAGDFLNALVIHGGMLGMGLATSLSYFVALIIMLLHFTKKDIIFKFSFKGLNLKDLAAILSTGSSSAMGSVSAMLRNAVLNGILVATVLSSTAVAAFGILNTVFNFTSSVMIGVGLTTAMIAGMILGEEDRTAAEHLVKTSVKTAIVVGAVLSILLFVCADWIAGVFGSSDGAKMVELAARGLRFYSLSIILYGINIVFVNYTQGMRRMVLTNVFCFLQGFVYMILPALLLAGILQADAVWLCFLIGEVLTLTSIIVYACVRKHGVPLKMSDYLFLKEPFGISAENTLDFSISKSEDVIPASSSVESFCAEKGASPKESMMLALFVEELGNNIIKFGFSDGKKHSIDVRAMKLDDGWRLRIRDDCKRFDPTEWIKLHNTDDPTKNIGIRMVCGMAKDISYLSTMELNNICITI
ncbi:MAG: ATP-binding protein [Ruminococcus sp.]|nr:ATP-binding protein [Ruminococcus sp.]